MPELIYWSELLHFRIAQFIRRCLDELQVRDPELTNVVDPLCDFILTRAEAIISLVKRKQLWDGDIISRSLSEAVVKMAFICCKDLTERSQRISEYTIDMIEIEDLRRSDRCRQILAEADVPKWHNVLDPLLLSSEEETALRKKWTKAARTKLEQKWSYLSMICAIDKEMRGTCEIPLGFRTLLHSYVNATHFIHADRTSFLLLWDRSTRQALVREKLDEAHAARLLGDSLWFAFGAWPVVARVVRIRPDIVEGYKDIEDDLACLSKRFQTVEAEFWAAQNRSDIST